VCAQLASQYLHADPTLKTKRGQDIRGVDLCAFTCVFWDKQIFVLVGSVVQAVGRTAKIAEGPHKTAQ